MPGLKALTDRLPVAAQSRGYRVLYRHFRCRRRPVVSLDRTAAGPRALAGLFAVAAACAAPWPSCSSGVVSPPAPPNRAHSPARSLAQVLGDRRTLAFCGGYFGHNWELFGFRAWLVAYLSWTHADSPDPWTAMPGLVAALATFLAVPASVLGNEGAHRWGRSAGCRASCLCPARWRSSSLLGRPVRGLLVPLLLLYAASMNLDSAALTAGLLTETASRPDRGTALALYSAIGFAGGFIGPVAFGIALDAFGRADPAGWAAGFVTGLGVGSDAGPLAAGPSAATHAGEGSQRTLTGAPLSCLR
jgi:hypothetical protein